MLGTTGPDFKWEGMGNPVHFLGNRLQSLTPSLQGGSSGASEPSLLLDSFGTQSRAIRMLEPEKYWGLHWESACADVRLGSRIQQPAANEICKLQDLALGQVNRCGQDRIEMGQNRLDGTHGSRQIRANASALKLVVRCGDEDVHEGRVGVGKGTPNRLCLIGLVPSGARESRFSR